LSCAKIDLTAKSDGLLVGMAGICSLTN